MYLCYHCYWRGSGQRDVKSAERTKRRLRNDYLNRFAHRRINNTDVIDRSPTPIIVLYTTYHNLFYKPKMRNAIIVRSSKRPQHSLIYIARIKYAYYNNLYNLPIIYVRILSYSEGG